MEFNITVNNLISDPSFRRWVLTPTSADTARWQRWLEEHPEHLHKVEEAKELLLALRPEEIQLSAQVEERVWAGIRKQTTQKDTVIRKLGNRTTLPVWKVAASALIGLAGAALIYLWLMPSYVSVSTSFAEVQKFYLPDSSWVVLNANSTLRYPKDWDEGVDREVWLEGEAFFKVSKSTSFINTQRGDHPAVKFIVHTDPLDVEVLGTEFNVNHRHQETKVILSEGKVRVRDTKAAQEDIIMKPGEMLSSSGKTMVLTQVNASTKTSWKEALVIFNNEPLADIFERLEDTYGYQIDVADKAILERRNSGSYPRDSVGLLFEKLEKLYQLQITTHEKQIHIGK